MIMYIVTKNVREKGILSMKKIFAILFGVVMLIVLSAPVSANAKQKKLNTKIFNDYGEVLDCSFPYYSKWKLNKETLGTDKILLTTSKNDSISIEVMCSYDDEEARIIIEGLSSKKGLKEFKKFLQESLDIPEGYPLTLSDIYKFKKDGNGRYLGIFNLGYYYSVIKVLDDDHVLVYTFDSNSDEISKTQKKRVLSYAKNSKLNDVINGMEGDDMSELMPKGKWFDKNSDTMLEFDGDKMSAKWWSGMETPEEFKVKIIKEYDNFYIVCVDGEYGSSFGMMSRLRIESDGTLTAYEEILDGESHSYKFVPEDRIEAERAVKDFSKDLPKTVYSEEIYAFSLVLCHYNVENMGSGTYSWEITKNDNGKYTSKLSGMGPSYVILQDSKEVDEAFVKGLNKLLKDEKIYENNGLFFSHDKNDIEYSLYINFESDEYITIKVGSKALDKWPIDNEKLIEYAMSVHGV